MSIKKVILIGANGTLGPHILNALRTSNLFDITVLARKSSKAKYPDDVTVEHMPDDPQVSDLVPLFEGQDAVVVASAGADVKAQRTFMHAASSAKVKRLIPANFGSCDVYDEETRKHLKSFRAKYEVQEFLSTEFSMTDGMSWTNLTCGHFLEFGLKTDFLCFDVEKRKARIFDDGDMKWSTSLESTVGKAVVQILSKLEETKNKMLYIQSFLVSQNDILKSLEKATGEKWEVEHVPSAEEIKSLQSRMEKDPDDSSLEEKMVSVIGMNHGNWEDRENFANSLLDLPKDNLDDVVKSIIDGK